MMAYDDTANDRLLEAMAEQLKIPFLRIARHAELAQLTGEVNALPEIEYTADMALRLVDGYLLSLRNRQIPGLVTEPVSVAATLQDTAHVLSRAAKQYHCQIAVQVASGQEPIMAHRESLETALSVLGYAMIESLPQEGQTHRLVLASHRNRGGIVAGVFGEHVRVTSDAYRRARALYGSARQAFPMVSAGSSAAIFVADSILNSLGAPLRIARYKGEAGLATTFLPSRQLQLV